MLLHCRLIPGNVLTTDCGCQPLTHQYRYGKNAYLISRMSQNKIIMDLLFIFICFIAMVIFIIMMVSLLSSVGKGIHDGPDTTRSRCITGGQYNAEIIAEMYCIWLGRIFDSASKIMFDKRSVTFAIITSQSSSGFSPSWEFRDTC